MSNEPNEKPKLTPLFLAKVTCEKPFWDKTKKEWGATKSTTQLSQIVELVQNGHDALIKDDRGFYMLMDNYNIDVILFALQNTSGAPALDLTHEGYAKMKKEYDEAKSQPQKPKLVTLGPNN